MILTWSKDTNDKYVQYTETHTSYTGDNISMRDQKLKASKLSRIRESWWYSQERQRHLGGGGLINKANHNQGNKKRHVLKELFLQQTGSSSLRKNSALVEHSVKRKNKLPGKFNSTVERAGDFHRGTLDTHEVKDGLGIPWRRRLNSIKFFLGSRTPGVLDRLACSEKVLT